MKMHYLKNTPTVKIDAEKCTGCTMCFQVCPREVIQLSGKKAVIADLDACIECGACEKNCQFDAVSVRYGVGCAYAVLMGGSCDSTSCC